MPELPVLSSQLEELTVRLPRAAQQSPYRSRWYKTVDGTTKIRSGVHIIKDLLTISTLYDGLGDILWVFEQCAFKTRNEAIVEGMTSLLKAHSSDVRHLSPESAEAEAFIHWSGPPLHQADGLIEKALDRYFKGSDWYFQHTSDIERQSSYAITSQVITRLKESTGKLPFLCSKAAL
eukprot:GHVU01186976.1.p1 GENE.GHVU01186976.1~~GHVU01186976.1.p1  ORF type:complete len:177 (+),score=16.85 GHVU01186976.1:339-869(+)